MVIPLLTSNKSKAIILGLATPQPNSNPNMNHSRKINIHNNSTSDEHIQDDEEMRINEIVPDSTPIENYNQNNHDIQSFLTNQQHAQHPGDMNVLSSLVKTDNDTKNDREINGVTTTYFLSNITTKEKGSLID